MNESSPKRICAIDASTNSLAYATFHGKYLKGSLDLLPTWESFGVGAR
jgi:hypothetical protein